jgi:hypothetical protein
MERDNITAIRNEDETELKEVASLIRPLPENVTPSEEFLRRMRLRLLKLEGRAATTDQQAA